MIVYDYFKSLTFKFNYFKFQIQKKYIWGCYFLSDGKENLKYISLWDLLKYKPDTRKLSGEFVL